MRPLRITIDGSMFGTESTIEVDQVAAARMFMRLAETMGAMPASQAFAALALAVAVLADQAQAQLKYGPARVRMGAPGVREYLMDALGACPRDHFFALNATSLAAVVADGAPKTPDPFAPACPGPDCMFCSGAACAHCDTGPGKPRCEHATDERHPHTD